jgi:hypothetical protein
MKLILLSFLAVCLSLQVSAQSNIISGVVFEKGSLSRLSKARIRNAGNQGFTDSDGMGMFSIPAVPGDTIRVSKQGFSDQSIIISSRNNLVIQLAKPILLSEVQVTGQTKKQELDEVRKQFRKKGSYYSGKPPVLAYIFTPLTALYELVGKTPGQARRFSSFYSREVEQFEIDRRFNAHTIEGLTSYEGKDLNNFLQIYRPAYQDISGWADYDLVDYIRKSALAFESAGRPEAPGLPKLPRAPDLREKVLKY